MLVKVPKLWGATLNFEILLNNFYYLQFSIKNENLICNFSKQVKITTKSILLLIRKSTNFLLGNTAVTQMI